MAIASASVEVCEPSSGLNSDPRALPNITGRLTELSKRSRKLSQQFQNLICFPKLYYPCLQVDRYHPNPPEGRYRWMMDQLDQSEYVLVICSEGYDRRYRNKEARGQGKGVAWEGGLIIEELYAGQGLNEKYIPILLSPDAAPHIPSGLKSYSVYRLFDETAYRADQPGAYQDLLRHLTSQPAYVPPPLGTVPELPPVS